MPGHAAKRPRTCGAANASPTVTSFLKHALRAQYLSVRAGPGRPLEQRLAECPLRRYGQDADETPTPSSLGSLPKEWKFFRGAGARMLRTNAKV